MKTYVICTRHPDYENSFDVVNGDEPGVIIHDIDLGGAELEFAGEELFSWAASHLDAAYGMDHEAKLIVLDAVWDVIYALGLTDEDIDRGLTAARSYHDDLRKKGLIR